MPPKIYRTGTLEYTPQGLLVLSLWLLSGDFAFTFFEVIFSRLMPLYLKNLHASNTLIGVMMGSVAGVISIVFLPNFSLWSDRHRGPLGRRIPFLYILTPATVLSLIAIGFAPELAGYLYDQFHVRLASAVSQSAFILILLCLFIVSYHFFNTLLFNVYQWLIRDVVPPECISRFWSFFKIVSAVSTTAFLWWVFPHLLDHRQAILLGVGGFYLVAFLLMCWHVQEGEYPSAPAPESRPGIVKSYCLYFRECLGLPIYRHYFIANLLISASACANSFSLLFYHETLGVDLERIGQILAWGSLANLLLYLPMGWLCDRIGPVRVILGALIMNAVVSLLSYCLIQDRTTLLIWNTLSTLPSVGLFGLGLPTASMQLYPKEKFGQFYSACTVFSLGFLIPGNYLAGVFMDIVHSNYRLSYLWNATLIVLAIYPMWRVYREWQKHGGLHHYMPPVPNERRPF
jgi:MFS family permease